MGADIHLVVEYSNTADFLHPTGLAMVDWPRQTDLFIAMSGLWGHPSLIPARGFPSPASFMACGAYGLQVVQPGDVDAMLAAPSILEEEALEALSAGKSQFLPHMKDHISNPGYVWATWLTRDEFLQCVAHSGVKPISLEVDVTLAMMELIESRRYHARMVFWFDV